MIAEDCWVRANEREELHCEVRTNALALAIEITEKGKGGGESILQVAERCALFILTGEIPESARK